MDTIWRDLLINLLASSIWFVLGRLSLKLQYKATKKKVAALLEKNSLIAIECVYYAEGRHPEPRKGKEKLQEAIKMYMRRTKTTDYTEAFNAIQLAFNDTRPNGSNGN